MLLQDMTFDAPRTGHVPVCPDHGSDCLGHAWVIQP